MKINQEILVLYSSYSLICTIKLAQNNDNAKIKGQ
nr:MAG TPA: hypothetical protein [Caudoviricetes sp.]